jgi:hypothetical protein
MEISAGGFDKMIEGEWGKKRYFLTLYFEYKKV